MPKLAISSPRSPPVNDDLDATLIREALQGNHQGFEALIQKHQPPIFRMVYRHLRQKEESEDVVQQVFIKAYQHLENFRGEAKFSTWLYTIALNLVRNHVRQRKIRRMDSLDISVKTEEGRAPQWPERGPPIEKIAEDRWELSRLCLALENLTDPYRSIFTLHYFQHLSLKEVAVRIGRPVGTIKVYLHRARKMVLNQLVT